MTFPRGGLPLDLCGTRFRGFQSRGSRENIPRARLQILESDHLPYVAGTTGLFGYLNRIPDSVFSDQVLYNSLRSGCSHLCIAWEASLLSIGALNVDTPQLHPRSDCAGAVHDRTGFIDCPRSINLTKLCWLRTASRTNLRAVWATGNMTLLSPVLSTPLQPQAIVRERSQMAISSARTVECLRCEN